MFLFRKPSKLQTDPSFESLCFIFCYKRLLVLHLLTSIGATYEKFIKSKPYNGTQNYSFVLQSKIQRDK